MVTGKKLAYLNEVISKHTDLTDKEVEGVIDHADSSVVPVKLSAIDEPADGETPTYNAAEEEFEWKTPEAAAIPEGRAKSAAETMISIPGVTTLSVTTYAVVAGRVHYWPFFVGSQITLDKILCEVTTGVAGLARMGIYYADKDWQPTTLVLDSEAINTTDIGVKSVDIDVTLAPGRYLLALTTNAAITLRALRGGSRYTGFKPTLGTGPFIVIMYVTKAYQALSFIGTPWTDVAYSTAPTNYMVFVRVATP